MHFRCIKCTVCDCTGGGGWDQCYVTLTNPNKDETVQTKINDSYF